MNRQHAMTDGKQVSILGLEERCGAYEAEELSFHKAGSHLIAIPKNTDLEQTSEILVFAPCDDEYLYGGSIEFWITDCGDLQWLVTQLTTREAD